MKLTHFDFISLHLAASTQDNSGENLKRGNKYRCSSLNKVKNTFAPIPAHNSYDLPNFFMTSIPRTFSPS